ncbi:MAG: PAS domain S-box protein [Bacteroidota bacterium]|nr:PAS domain S-box protein [Bacteroidota bacterium]
MVNKANHIFSFQESHFSRLFPFYILINDSLEIVAAGKSLEKIYPALTGTRFSDRFSLSRPETTQLSFEALSGLVEKLVILNCHNRQKTILRGQLERIPENNQLLFIGSPWFGNIEEVVESHLTLSDFAFHDPMIDLLHVLKTQEITNQDLKQLLITLQSQKEILKKDQTELERLSLVAKANNNGVIFIDLQGKISWCNDGFEKLSGYERSEVIGKNPIDIFKGPLSDRQVLKQLAADFASGNTCIAEVVHYRKDGSWFWGRSKGQSVTNKDNSVYYFALIEDITEEKTTQDKLRDYEKRLKIALSNVGDNFWEHNFVTGKTLFSNPTNNLLGFPIHDMEDASAFWWSRVHPDDLVKLQNNDSQYRSGTIDHHTMEYRVVYKDGSVRWVLDRGMVTEKDPDGLPLKIIGTHINITRQKELELELSQRVNQFRSFSENIPGVIYEYEFRKDGTEGLRYVSPNIETVFGISAEEFVNYTKYIHPDDLTGIMEKNRISRETLAPFNDESRLLIPGKDIIWHAVTSSFSYYTPEGNAVFTGLMQDITQRKNAEQALKIKEEKYRSIISNMRLGLLEVDNEEVIQFANHSFCEMSGYTMDELKGRKANQLFAADNLGFMEEKNNQRLKGISDAYELLIKNKEGLAKWWLISGAPRYDDSGNVVGTIGIHLDITEQKNLEMELIKAREIAESSVVAKQTFLANMSHEIRTPMNAIMGMSNQLAKTKLDSEQQLFLDTIHSAADNLLVIINDILDLSKIEAGRLNLETIGFDLKEIIEKARQVMLYKTEEKDLSLTTRFYDPRIASIVKGDPYRINQILLNLMSNATKFTEKGYVDVSCKLLSEQGNIQTIQLIVKDTGIGMDEMFVKNLFTKFTQEDDSVTRRFGGTGLGMSICKELTTLMNGTIEVSSKKGEGTTIYVSIPLEKGTEFDQPGMETEEENREILQNKKILVADDNEMNRLVASTMLKHYGIIIEEAENGLDAIEKIARDHFDLVLMDVQMPLMDGLAATIEIRKNISQQLPVIALTALAYKEDEDKLLLHGMNGYLSKPFEERELIKTITYWLQQSEALPFRIEKRDTITPRYNLSGLEEMTDHDPTFIQNVLTLFIQKTPQLIEAIFEDFEKKDYQNLRKKIHQLKSSAKNIRVGGIVAEIAEIEAMADMAEQRDQLKKLLFTIQLTVNDTISQIKKDFTIQE